jgi:hypothetical protein
VVGSVAEAVVAAEDSEVLVVVVEALAAAEPGEAGSTASSL